jgi:hypothetical protein
VASVLKKRMSPKKFYILNYQLTELIPLFSYLERLNGLRSTLAGLDNETPGGDDAKKQTIKISKSRSTLGSQEELKESDKIKVQRIEKD